MKTYAANELNQYTSIANPVAVGLRGTATNTATVTVNSNAASRDSVTSTTRPWHFALPADNANGGVYTLASIMAVVNPSGTNTQDSVESATGFVYAPPQNETPAYDDDGNLISDGRWHYTWNGENQLICAEEQVCPTNRTLRKVDYAYDHQGRMVWKKISHEDTKTQSWQEEKTISYLWDNFNIIAETSVADSATKITYNVWGLDLDGTLQGAGGVGGLLAVVKDSATYIPAWDANGNIMEYVADDGTIAAHREYDPFGGTVVVTGDANAFTHWFSTKPWCMVTGLSEYQYRKYSPALGRWLSRDPMEERGGFNLYCFVKNSSIFLVDLYGLDEWQNHKDSLTINTREVLLPDGGAQTVSDEYEVSYETKSECVYVGDSRQPRANAYIRRLKGNLKDRFDSVTFSIFGLGATKKYSLVQNELSVSAYEYDGLQVAEAIIDYEIHLIYRVGFAPGIGVLSIDTGLGSNASDEILYKGYISVIARCKCQKSE